MHSNKLMLGGNIFGHFTNKFQTIELIHQAKELGIQAIDTADVYSKGLSEEYIGDAIKHERNRWYIATKVGLASNASPNGLGKKKNILHKAEESLKRLQTDYIDLYQIHHFDNATPLEETLEAFFELKKRGWIRFGGVSNYSIEQVERLGRHSHPIDYHQVPLNITHASEAEKFIESNRLNHLSLLAYSVLARGLFHEKYLQGEIPLDSRASRSRNIQKDLTETFLAKLQTSFEFCNFHGCSLLSIALHWVCQLDIVKWSIIGVRNIEQLHSLHQAYLKKLSKKQLEEVENIWKQQIP